MVPFGSYHLRLNTSQDWEPFFIKLGGSICKLVLDPGSSPSADPELIAQAVFEWTLNPCDLELVVPDEVKPLPLRSGLNTAEWGVGRRFPN